MHYNTVNKWLEELNVEVRRLQGLQEKLSVVDPLTALEVFRAMQALEVAKERIKQARTK